MKELILIIVDSPDITIIIRGFMVNFMTVDSTHWNWFGKNGLKRNKVSKRLKKKNLNSPCILKIMNL